MKPKIISLLIYFLSVMNLNARPYFFEQDSEPYVNLTGTTSINGATIWTPFQSFTVPIGFNFRFMGLSPNKFLSNFINDAFGNN